MLLKDIIEFKNGKKKPSSKGNIPIYGGNGILDYTDQNNQDGESLIIGRVGAYCGCVYSHCGKCWISDNAIVGKVKEGNDFYYCYYLLKILNLNSRHVGSGQPLMTQEILNNIEVNPCNYKIQQKIANILSKLDDKIKLNNSINNNLQELMNVNYQEYIRKAEDYVSIPIKDILDFETGVEPGSKSYSSIQLNDYIKFYRVGDMNTDCNNYIPRELAKGKIAEKDDVLVSFDATIGRIAYGIYGAFSTGMKNIKPKREYENIITNGLIYTYFNDSNTQDVLIQNAIGTTILHASGSINNLYLKFDKEKIKKLSLELELMFSKMKQIKAENQILTQLRDTLLPKLMNGEIDLDNIEI